MRIWTSTSWLLGFVGLAPMAFAETTAPRPPLTPPPAVHRVVPPPVPPSPPPALTSPTERLAGRRLADKLLVANDGARAHASGAGIAHTLRRYGVRRAALRGDFLRQHDAHYTKELPPVQIRDQGSSNRCWIFAALNVAESYGGRGSNEKRPLSRAYLNARYLQMQAHELLQSGGDAKSLTLDTPSRIEDRGTVSYALNLVDKYGAVPERVMRDFRDDSAPATVMKLLETLIVRTQEDLNKTGMNGPAAKAIVERANTEIDRAIARGFTGKDRLPEKFVVDGKEYTPKTYAAAHVAVKADDFVTLVDDRTRKRGWRQSGADVGRGEPDGDVRVHEVYNTRSLQEIRQVIKRAIDDGQGVAAFIPIDGESAPYMINNADAASVAGLPRAGGIMSLHAFDYAAVGFPAPITDRETIQRRGLHPTSHFVTITGYELDGAGNVVKWKVENSWGTDAGDGGVYHMYADFFDAFVQQVTVPRTAVPPKRLAQILHQKEIDLGRD